MLANYMCPVSCVVCNCGFGVGWLTSNHKLRLFSGLSTEIPMNRCTYIGMNCGTMLLRIQIHTCMENWLN